MQIIYLIFFFLIISIIFILRTPFPYSCSSLSSIDLFFNALIFKGNSDESLMQNTMLSIIEPISGDGVGVIKYYEKGKTGIYFGVTKPNLHKKDRKFIRKIKDLKLDIFVLKKGVFSEDHYFVDINNDLKLFKKLLEFIWSEIYEADLIFELYFYDKVCKNKSKSEKINKGQKDLNSLDLPFTKWQWVLYKLRGGKSVSKG